MTAVFGEGRHVRVVLPTRIGDARIVIDDADITRAVTGLDLHWHDGGRTADVFLHLPVIEDAHLDSHATGVHIRPETADLLTAAGWIPPEQAQRLLTLADVARAWLAGTPGTLAVDLAAAVTDLDTP